MNPSPSITNDERVTLDGTRGRMGMLAGLGVVLIAAGFALGWIGHDGPMRVWHAYLTNFCFFLSISLGALFFVLLQHATKAGWSVTVRRLAELLAATMPLWALLFLPLFFGAHWLYEWTDKMAVAEDVLLQKKSAYLNCTFFTVRAVVYFTIWCLLAWFYLSRSVEQDTSGDPKLTVRMQRLSPIGLILFALTVTFATFDWLMSLDAAWFSTIFGIYYFSGSLLAFLATLVLSSLWLQRTGRITSSITVEHYHDLGKLMLAFVIFWGYIAFSQYLLIWYANLPEETGWYLTRQSGPWFWVSLTLVFGHLILPFFGLLPRWAKRHKAVLGFWAIWILCVHWVDMAWLVKPSMGGGSLHLGPADPLFALGMGCLFLAALCWTANDRALVPQNDPRVGVE